MCRICIYPAYYFAYHLIFLFDFHPEVAGSIFSEIGPFLFFDFYLLENAPMDPQLVINTKFVRRLFLILSLIFPILLWVTKSQWYRSMSAFAGADNEVFYIGMHLVASWFWLLNGAASELTPVKRKFDYFVGMGMGSILMIDMYYIHWLHNLLTGLTASMALFTMIYYSTKKNLPTNVSLVSIGGISFIMGLCIEGFHLFLAEWILMACVAIHMFRKV